MLGGCWCNIVVLNVHAPSEDKSDVSKDSLHEELEQVFNHFPKYHMKIQLGDLNAKLERENIFKLTIRMRVYFRIVMMMMLVKYATSENVVVNLLTPNDHYSGRTTPLTYKRCILYIYSTNIGTEYFKHGI
jgi:hypothetical protein